MKKLLSLALIGLMSLTMISCGDDDPRPEPASRDAYITMVIPQSTDVLGSLSYTLTIASDKGTEYNIVKTLDQSSAVTVDKIEDGKALLMISQMPLKNHSRFFVIKEIVKGMKNVVTFDLKAAYKDGAPATEDRLNFYTGFQYEVDYSSGAVIIDGNFGYYSNGAAYDDIKGMVEKGIFNASGKAAAKQE